MATRIKDLGKVYKSALKAYLSGVGESALEDAYKLGRRALEQGLGMMDITEAHHDALGTILRSAKHAAQDRETIVSQAGGFLAECLSPFEMAQRGFQETIAALNALNERLEAEVEKRTHAMRESEERYRTLIHISPDAITVTDTAGKIVLSNQQAARLHGYSDPREELGSSAARFVAPEDMSAMTEMAERLLRDSEPQRMEYQLLTVAGARIPVEARVSLMRDTSGQPSGFIGVVRDISERKEAELQLVAQAQRQAAAAELGQLALAETSIDHLMHETVRWVVETLGVEFCELLELTPDGDTLILRDGIGWHDGCVGTTTVKADSNSQAGYTLLSSELVFVKDLSAETRFTPPELLTQHGVKSGMTVIIHSDGQPYGVLGAHTARQRSFTVDEGHFLQALANTLAMAIKNRRLLDSEADRRKAAERANEERLKMLAIITHELRTPLSSIKGFASTLLADDVVWDTANQIDFIQTINEEADKLSNLLEQLLDVSKMEAGAFRMNPVDESLPAIVSHAMGQLKACAGQHELVIHIPESLSPVHADIQRTGQVLVNLVENAAKYSAPNTTITLSAEADAEFATISVKDEGRGIPVDEREKIFQPFYRSENKTYYKTKGVGLGLFICQRIVEAQGGQIGIKSHKGAGTIFTFTLPLAGVAESVGEVR